MHRPRSEGGGVGGLGRRWRGEEDWGRGGRGDVYQIVLPRDSAETCFFGASVGVCVCVAVGV